MLIEFRVENYRSLREEQVLSLESAKLGEDKDVRPRTIAGLPSKILPVVALYGANASGKSNVLAGLAFMKMAVDLSHRRWGPEEGVPRDPFAWGDKRKEPSLFEVEVIIDGVKYRYGFQCNDECFLEEWLFAWPKSHKQMWFERDGDHFKFGEFLKGENKFIQEFTRPNALFLSTAAQLGHTQLTHFTSWFQSIEAIHPGIPSPRIRGFGTRTKRGFWGRTYQSDRAIDVLFEKGHPLRHFSSSESTDLNVTQERFKAFLKSADLGIVDVRSNREKNAASDVDFRFPRFELKHQGDFEDTWLPLEEESGGTQTLFHLALPVLKSLSGGTPLLVDELEASLHPNLAEMIVRQFNDPATNPHNAQLIFSTHDTNLLGNLVGEPALRRDQVWLTEKDQQGGTILYPLTDYKPRKDENLERGYIQGRYGAIPFLGQFGAQAEKAP